MPSRRSKPPPRDRLGRCEVIPSPVAELSDTQSIWVCCEDYLCTHSRGFSRDQLLEMLGPKATMRDIMWRMICSQCGRRPYSIRLVTK